MNRIKIVLGLLGMAAMAGCDDGPSFNVTAEPAGANCPTGGYRIEADGQTFYSCNGQAATEEIAEGAEGNPCFGPALRVSFPTAEGTRYAYVCQPIEVDPASEGVLIGMFRAQLEYFGIMCDCTMDPDAQAACQQQLNLYEAVVHVTENCLPEVLAVTGPIPESERAAVECVVAAYDAFAECMAGIDAAECSMETEAEIDACEEIIAESETCPEPTEALDEWRSTVEGVSEFLGCEFIGGL